ncbi:hypothetical protein Tco_0499829, partial [Tanacetum coccineum]
PMHPIVTIPLLPDFGGVTMINIFLAGNCPQMLGEYIASAPLTPLVKPGGGIRPIVLDGLQFGVGVAGGSEAILHSVNRLIEAYGDDVSLSILLVDFKNAFNLVDREVMLREVRLRCPAISRWEDPRSRLAGIYPPNIARPLHDVKLLGGLASVDFDFGNELVTPSKSDGNGIVTLGCDFKA